jgi:hypothetical protein
MERFTDEQRKVKIQELIDRILYLDEQDYDEFINKYDELINTYKPKQIEVNGVKYFKVKC